jgi:hypothetical protein
VQVRRGIVGDAYSHWILPRRRFEVYRRWPSRHS